MPLEINLIEDLNTYIEELYNRYHGEDGRFASGPGGRGAKAFSRMSAHPDERSVPHPNITAGDEADDNYSAATLGHGSVAKWIKSAYTGDLGGGYKSEVTFVDHSVANVPPIDELDNNGYMIQGHIVDPKNQVVGEFTRYIMNVDGALVVTHELLDIENPHRGHGLADRFNARAVAAYQEMGVDRIILSAELEVGPYAWARQGFRLDAADDVERMDSLNYLIATGERNERPKGDDRKDLDTLQNASDNGEDVQPIDLAAIGEARAKAADPNATTWWGKEALLGQSWKGVYYFDRKNPVTAAAVQLEYANRRPAWWL